jgi:hypothetical protein
VSGRTSPPTVTAAGATLPVAVPVAGAPGRPAIGYELDPVPARKQAAPSAAAASEPVTGTGAVKPEYARAGQWKAQPGPATAPAN